MTGFAPHATATSDDIRAAMARVEKSLVAMLYDASGSARIPITNINDDIRAAVARVEDSLAIVLAEIAKIQAEMHQTSPPATIIPLRPETWAGSPLRTRYGRTSR
jgi:hypothetical protein